jgi:DNA-binding NtrC family response regulator
MPKHRVLIVDDEAASRQGLSELVTAWGYETAVAEDGLAALERIDDFGPIVVITDVFMPRLDGFGLLERLAARPAAPSVIMLTGQGSVEAAIRAVRDAGAFYYFEKPVDTRRLQLVLAKAIEFRGARTENVRLQRQIQQYGQYGQLIGGSPPVREVYAMIEQVAPSTASVLITGESGTGKEICARTIHELSNRAGQPFIALNCAAVPDTLMESELFGHEKGAFTGAVERRLGCFELANNGTLLLDEIGEMPMGLQTKLLRVLEDRSIRRIGGTREIPVDVRVIAATNRSPELAVQKGEFREDLLYRLNVIQIHLPPLRQRREDVPALAEHLVGVMCARHNRPLRVISQPAMDALIAYAWPGNVRELRNVIERAVIISHGDTIEVGNLAPQVLGQATRSSASCLEIPIGLPLDEVEKRVILATLARSDNNKTRAAEVLEISLKTLHNKLKLYRESESSTGSDDDSGQ